jgi:hypothetical protein
VEKEKEKEREEVVGVGDQNAYSDDQVQEQTEKIMVLEHKCRALQTKLG